MDLHRCVIAGTGTLGMPHAVAQSGWLGTLVVALALFMSTTTGNMLIKCLYLKSNTRRNSYQEIARDAYGPIGCYFAVGTVGLNLFGCAILYIILAGTLIQTMVNTGHEDDSSAPMPIYVYVIACSAFVWACLICTKSMKEIALLSIVGAGATLGVVLITVGMSIELLQERAAVTLSAAHKLVDWSKIPMSFATIAFAYGGNVVYPHLEQSMRYPRSWSKALWLALSLCFVMYIMIAVAGYMAFGSDTRNPILDNLPHGAWSIVAHSLITLHVLLAAPILLTSLAMMIESALEMRSPSFAQGTKIQQFLKRAIPRTIIIVLVALIASVIPFFGDVMDLLGALTTCLLVFIMPILFYYRLGGMSNASIAGRLWAWFIFLVGVVAMVLGTYDATKHLVRDIKSK
ncbi:transmembrane amino acid transporter protein-domain-containing protein [Gamsiella multidivaricata]|uniref:transmembrane amino acid transporter protein-domain-containing protein n=1 Tax=Gamsiella multidivaricata TaxID=101098 RepID=UPI00221F9D79|nr:transmembrane amino acid transporter protein-domain-containing protein [Gamsiella multidivaricata]KAI7823537.1 transmembrane amino acid transporter protein-domain-containing protein [Gamsiella multidivaricata]